MENFSHLKIQEAIKSWVDTYTINSAEINMFTPNNSLQIALSEEYYKYLKDTYHLLHSVTFMNANNLEISMNVIYTVAPLTSDTVIIHPVFDESIEKITPKFWYNGCTYVTTYRRED